MFFVISSPHLLYRLLCLFPDLKLERLDCYKVLWDFHLKHKPTGYGLRIYESKGGVSVRVRGLSYISSKRVNDGQERNVFRRSILSALRCTSPYICRNKQREVAIRGSEQHLLT
jgi:hypothetical protein